MSAIKSIIYLTVIYGNFKDKDRSNRKLDYIVFYCGNLQFYGVDFSFLTADTPSSYSSTLIQPLCSCQTFPPAFYLIHIYVPPS